ncbi:hypothetical protein C2S53_009774 [Perilla frutescens var. hirtella]|uniref:MADS-box domain-containing protein n=1 Tax=Perilla frutescens var. hirtella TaxID=608512 RepID=A0AAD4JH45_PERFH|nr:hypothetical protein C2S53_009774 [Perilla frutescens var. hirtella]
MAKIENETNLQVTFSKRRAGVFKKASELSTLCGAESAVVVFSPGNKPHSFGHPNVETVANRFLNAGNTDRNQPANSAEQLIMAHGEAAMHQRNHELIAIEAQLEREKLRKKELDELAKTNQGSSSTPPQLDQLNYEQLNQLKKSIVRFKREFEEMVKNSNTNAAGNSSWDNVAGNYTSSSHHQAGLGHPQVGLGFPQAGLGHPQVGLGFSEAGLDHPQVGLGFPQAGSGHSQAELGFPQAGLGFPPDYGYGGVNINPTINPGGPSFAYPVEGMSQGYTVQYPPVGPSASHHNYVSVDPAGMVQYHPGSSGSSDPNPDASPLGPTGK